MMENKEQIIKLAEENVLHTYNRIRWCWITGRACTSMIRKGNNTWISRRGSRCRLWAIIIRAMTRR